MNDDFPLTRYWAFGLVCVAYTLFLLRQLVKNRVTLQNALAFVMTFVFFGSVAVLLPYFPGLVRRLGFELQSNLIFLLALGALTFLQLLTLVALSRAEIRTVTLTQEVALLREELVRRKVLAPAEPPRSLTGENPVVPSNEAQSG